MFSLIKKVIILVLSAISVSSYCLLLRNQECSVRKVIIGNDLSLVFKNISFHQSCKCGCLLDKKVFNNFQKWNKDKCRCECLEIKDCDIGYSWNFINCRCEMKKLAALIESEECDIETDEIIKNKTVTIK